MFLPDKSSCMRASMVLVLSIVHPCFMVADEKPASRKSTELSKDYLLEVVKRRRVKQHDTCTITLKKGTSGKWVFIAAAPPDLPCQTGICATIEPGGRLTSEHSKLKRSILLTRIPGDSKALPTVVQVQVHYEATLLERKLVPATRGLLVRKPAPLEAKEKKRLMSPGGLYDFQTRRFVDWMAHNGLRRQEGENSLRFARKVFNFLKTNYKGSGLKPDHHASVLCHEEQLDCGGYAVVFVATLRANGIPARLLVGRFVECSKDRAPSPHVRTEFYADGIGWIPVDPAQHVFGADTPDHLVLHVDNGLILDTSFYGKQSVNWLQGLLGWPSRAEDLKGSVVKHTWRSTRTELKAEQGVERERAVKSIPKDSSSRPPR